MQLLEKLWEMWENIDISQLEILSQQKEEGITYYQKEIIILQSFSQNIL